MSDFADLVTKEMREHLKELGQRETGREDGTFILFMKLYVTENGSLHIFEAAIL